MDASREVYQIIDTHVVKLKISKGLGDGCKTLDLPSSSQSLAFRHSAACTQVLVVPPRHNMPFSLRLWKGQNIHNDD